MSRPKREFGYPKLSITEKELVYDFLCACREDFMNGMAKMKIMYKLSKEEWIQKNIMYFQHCISAVDYAHAKLRLPVRQGKK
jgi:hypothetical protein